MAYIVYLRGGSETEENKGIVSSIVPTMPKEDENGRQLVVTVNRPDGTLERVYRFSKECVILIKEQE